MRGEQESRRTHIQTLSGSPLPSERQPLCPARSGARMHTHATAIGSLFVWTWPPVRRGPAKCGGGLFGSVSGYGLRMARVSRYHDRQRRAAGQQLAVPRPTTVAQPAAASCASVGDRLTGSFLGIVACYEHRHVSGGLTIARHAARTSGKPSRSTDCSV